MFFDGGCPLCRHEIQLYQRLDNDNSVEWCDINQHPQQLEQWNLSVDQTMKVFHVVDEQGRVQLATAGFLVIWRHLPYWRWLAKLVVVCRLIKPLDYFYYIFARRRYQQRQSAQACPCKNQS